MLNRPRILSGFVFVLAMALAPLGISPATSAEEDVPAVQLAPFAVAAHRKSGTRQMMSVTVYLELEHKAQIKPVCDLAPRLQETSLAAISAARLQIIKSKLIVGDVDMRVRDALNRLFNGNPVRKAYVLAGRKNIGAGSASKLSALQPCVRVIGFDPSQFR